MRILILALIFAASGAFAQMPAPAWVNQIKLSGLSGTTDQRLALINGKTFSQGEANNLQIAGRNVVVKCLEIREQSALVQIQGLASPYELNITGGIIAMNKSPVSALNTQAVAGIEPPTPIPVQPVRPLILSGPTQPSPPVSNGKIFSLTTILLFGGIFFALMMGIGIASRTTRSQQRKVDSQTTVSSLNDKGDEGEARVAETISNHFSRSHLLLNNITLPTSNGTTQIDHILVTDTGIFVIETKHFTGWIYGNPLDAQWTQVVFKIKSGFPSPLRQNYGHFKALQTLLDLPDSYFHRIVVFTGDAEFKTDLGPEVFHLAGLIPFLNVERPVILDEGQRAGIIGRIEMKREQRSVETDEYHRNHLLSRFGDRTSKLRPQTIYPSDNRFASAVEDDKYKPKS